MGESREDHEEQGHHCHHGTLLTLSSSGRLQVHGGYTHVCWLLGGEDKTFRTLDIGAPVHSSQTTTPGSPWSPSLNRDQYLTPVRTMRRSLWGPGAASQATGLLG